MNAKEIFKIWTPTDAKWIDWVRPVPFIGINENLEVKEYCDYTIPNIFYLNNSIKNTAIILDLPSYESIKEGIALTKFGFRPIPIYNGTDSQVGTNSIIDNHAIEMGLKWGALELNKINISIDAPPVFLLDSNRTQRFRMNASIFDNSWDIYNQDMPTAEYFLSNGINKIIVRGEKIQKDLKRILYEYQKKGLKILYTDGNENPKDIKIKKPLGKME